MATIKSYTDLNQSKHLTEILPIESADMHYRDWKRMTKYIRIAHVGTGGKDDLPCWSLAALLDALPDTTCVFKKTYKDGRVLWKGVLSKNKDLFLEHNPVDACYEMILKLHKQNQF